jgi:AraC-like DNA-binding protein
MIARDDGFRGLTDGPQASGLASRLAVLYLENKGIDAEPLLSRSGLSRPAINERKRIRVASQIKFLKLVSQAAKDDWVGLTLAGDFDLREMGMLYYVASSSRQLGDALVRLARYVRLGNEALVVRMKERPDFCIEVSYAGVQRHQDRHQIELFAFALLRLCRKLAGRNISPRVMKFIHHRSGDLNTIRRLFGCDVEFDADADEMIFDAGITKLPLVGDDSFLNELIVRMCEDAMVHRVANISPFRTLVENTIAPLLPHAEASTKTVAKRIGLSERTFARRLAAEGLSFGEILDQLRRDLAVRYLDEDIQASQIAWLLGFHQPSSFSHACRRWTGKSPSEFRRSPRVN